MNLSENPLVKNLTSLAHSQVKTDCSLSVSLYANEQAATADCTHTWQGGGRRSLLQWLVLIALVTVFCTAVRCLCRLCSRH